MCRSVWSDLAPELLELVLQRLTLMDYLKCRQVCSSWRITVDDALATRRCPPASQFPFILFLPHIAVRNNNVPNPNANLNLLSLTQDRIYSISTKTWVVGIINRVRSVEGWLMFQRYYYRTRDDDQTYCQLSFFNPVSGARFKLPELPVFSGRDYNGSTFHSNRIVFSSVPDSPEFIVAFWLLIKLEGQLRQQLAFCKVTDKSWTLVETVESRTIIFYDIAIHGCRLYACTKDVVDFVIVFNLGDANAITAERLVMLNPRPIPTLGHFEVKDGLRHLTDEEMYMLAMDSTRGELFLVFHLRDKTLGRDRDGEYLIRTKGFRVFKLDLSGPRWLEVNSLGDRSLLFDWTGFRVISATDLNGPGEFNFNGGNCIFFCIANTLSIDSSPKHDLGVFSLTDKSIKRFPLNSSLPASHRNVWFTPSPW